MIKEPMDILQQFPVRKTNKQKQAFREAANAYCRELGYDVRVETGSFGAKNIVVGDPDNAKYLVGAHYDTCAHMPFPNFITPCNPVIYLLYQFLVIGLFLLAAFVAAFLAALITGNVTAAVFVAYAVYFGFLFLIMFGPANKNNANDNTSGVVSVLEIARSLPENLRKDVCFVLFDLEEAGLIGSKSYSKTHKAAVKNQMFLNLDCVGDGDYMMMFPTAKLKKAPEKLKQLDVLVGQFGQKSIQLHRKGFAVCPSDHRNFPYGVGIMAFKRKKGIGLYCDRIHTNRDTILEQTNVNILRAAIVSLVCQ